MTQYLLQQPKRLESLAIVKTAAWITLETDKIMSTLHKHDGTETEAVFSRRIEVIRNCLECNVPRTLHDALATQVMRELSVLADNAVQAPKRPSKLVAFLWCRSRRQLALQTDVIRRMIETICTRNLTVLSLSTHRMNIFKMFRDLVPYKSYLLAGLIRLDLNFDSFDMRDDTGFTDDHIILLLEKLHNLKYLTIKCVCTYNILRCIANNCVFIEELNVSTSSSIDNDSINVLTELRNLRSINLYGTSVRQKGIEKLLLACRNIEHIVVPHLGLYYTNSMSYILEQIANADEKYLDQLKIKTYRSNCDSSKRLQLVVQMCPLIQNLFVKVNTRRERTNIMAIAGLQELRELTLFGYVFYKERIKEALTVVGCNLVQLRLLQIEQIDINALMDIGQMCPNLQSLTLDNCIFVDHPPQHIKNLDFQPFRNLKKLILNTTNSFDVNFVYDLLFSEMYGHLLSLQSSQNLKSIHELAFSLLSNCLNIEYIEITTPVWLTEDIMLKVLDENPLTYLKQLKIWNSPGVSQKITTLVMDRIIQNCTSHPEVVIGE